MSIDWITPKWEPTPGYGPGWLIAQWRGARIQRFASPQYRFSSLTSAAAYCAHLNAGGEHARSEFEVRALIHAALDPQP